MVNELNFGSFAAAKKTQQIIKSVAESQVEKLRPALKTAKVDSINTAEKYCMVTYVGETLSVKVPYNNVAPSYVGQFVRVGGPANDRKIEEVLGPTDSEDRLAKIEAMLDRREPAHGSWYRSANTEHSDGVNSLIWTDAWYQPVVFENPASPGTEIVIPTSGWYDVRAQITFQGGNRKDLYIQVIPISGAANYDIAQAASQMSGDGFNITYLTISAARRAHLEQGDKIKVNIGAAANYTLYGGASGRTSFQISRVISD